MLTTIAVEAQPATIISLHGAELAWATVRAEYGLAPNGQAPVLADKGNTKLDAEMARDGRTLIASHTLPSGRANGTCVNDRLCAEHCVTAGSWLAGQDNVQQARHARLRLFETNWDAYATLLLRDVEALGRRVRRHNQTLAVRLNVGSDVAWERILPDAFWEAVARSGGHAYDYTKRIDRVGWLVPSVYRTTYSATSATRRSTVERLLDRGDTVTVVLPQPANRHDKSVPEEFAGFPMISGDATDDRYLDPPGVLIGLSAKGRLVQEWHRTGQWGALVARFDMSRPHYRQSTPDSE